MNRRVVVVRKAQPTAGHKPTKHRHARPHAPTGPRPHLDQGEEGFGGCTGGRRPICPKSRLGLFDGLSCLNFGGLVLALSSLPFSRVGFYGMGNCASSADPLPLHTAAIATANGNTNAVSTCVSTPTKSINSGSEFNALKCALSTSKAIEDFRYEAGYDNVHIFTYNELRLATKNFRPDQILGEGGFGVVYRGLIDETVRKGFQDTEVAVKMLNPDSFQGDREWLAEVNYLGQFSHPNLVRLIGYCCEDDHRLLVYEYMASGCLEKHLFRRVCLTMPWPTRMKIALGAAKGLACLHGAERPVIYRDFKTSNILLDAEFNAKLSDFGLAKEGPMGDQTHVSTRVMGTYGYAAPEYVMTGHLTARSDVYGYGVVLLEMLIGRRALDRSRPSQEHNLVEWARPLLVQSKKLLKIIDPRMEGQYATKVIQKVAVLAYQCLSPNPKGRPAMNQVVEILQALQSIPNSKDMEAATIHEASKCTRMSPQVCSSSFDDSCAND